MRGGRRKYLLQTCEACVVVSFLEAAVEVRGGGRCVVGGVGVESGGSGRQKDFF